MMTAGHEVIPVMDRFMNKVHMTSDCGCWLWGAGGSYCGYGKFWLRRNGREEFWAHRASWILHNGEIPDELHVLHRCDVRACVNPDHLFLGTNADNMDDRDAKNAVRVAAGLPTIVGRPKYQHRGKIK